MAQLGFISLLSDSGIFFNKAKKITAIVYVDDVLFLGPDKKSLLDAKQQFMKRWECRDLGKAQEFLHIHIHCKNGKIYIDQAAYLEKSVQHFNQQNVKQPPTPLPKGYQPSSCQDAVEATLHSKY